MKYLLVFFISGCSSLALTGSVIKDDSGKCHLLTPNTVIFDYPCTEDAKNINHR